MELCDLWQFLKKTLFEEPSTPVLFNPYHDADAQLDRKDAVKIRRANLKHYLAAFAERPAILLVGEAPGPHGCRFSGVPFTSEHQIVARTLPFTGRQSSLRPQ